MTLSFVFTQYDHDYENDQDYRNRQEQNTN